MPQSGLIPTLSFARASLIWLFRKVPLPPKYWYNSVSKCVEDLQGTLAPQCPQGSLCLCSDCLPLSSHWGNQSEVFPKSHFWNSLNPEEGEARDTEAPAIVSLYYPWLPTPDFWALDNWVDIGKRITWSLKTEVQVCSVPHGRVPQHKSLPFLGISFLTVESDAPWTIMCNTKLRWWHYGFFKH